MKGLKRLFMNIIYTPRAHTSLPCLYRAFEPHLYRYIKSICMYPYISSCPSLPLSLFFIDNNNKGPFIHLPLRPSIHSSFPRCLLPSAVPSLDYFLHFISLYHPSIHSSFSQWFYTVHLLIYCSPPSLFPLILTSTTPTTSFVFSIFLISYRLFVQPVPFLYLLNSFTHPRRYILSSIQASITHHYHHHSLLSCLLSLPPIYQDLTISLSLSHSLTLNPPCLSLSPSHFLQHSA